MNLLRTHRDSVSVTTAPRQDSAQLSSISSRSLPLPNSWRRYGGRYSFLMVSAVLMVPLYLLAGRFRCPRTEWGSS